MATFHATGSEAPAAALGGGRSRGPDGPALSGARVGGRDPVSALRAAGRGPRRSGDRRSAAGAGAARGRDRGRRAGGGRRLAAGGVRSVLSAAEPAGPLGDPAGEHSGAGSLSPSGCGAGGALAGGAGRGAGSQGGTGLGGQSETRGRSPSLAVVGAAVAGAVGARDPVVQPAGGGAGGGGCGSAGGLGGGSVGAIDGLCG